MCICICVHLFFMGIMKRREICMYVYQVLNGVINGMLSVYVCNMHVFMYESFLLVCALHPWAMMAPFLIRTIIVGLSPGSTS